MTLIKTLIAANKSEKTPFRIPKSVQQSIPIQRVYRDGVFHVGSKHSKTWRFRDVNYTAASEDTQGSIFRAYCGVLNCLPTDAAAKITILNHKQNPVNFEQRILMRERGDGLDKYRRESNRILKEKSAESNDLVQANYLNLANPAGEIGDSGTWFRRVESNLCKSFEKLDSGVEPLTCKDRLGLLHGFFRPGEEPNFSFDMKSAIRTGTSFKDYICPDSLSFKADHFQMGSKFGRVLFLKTYGSYIEDDTISELSNLPRSLMISIDLLPVPTDEAIREVQSQILGVETDISRWQQRQNARNNFTANIPYDLEQTRAETKEYLDDLTTRDQRMIFAIVTMVHLADSLQELDADTETLLAIGREHLCTLAVLRYQQEDGLNTVLPYGLRRIKVMRTLTTESTAVLMPFRVQEIQDPGGIYYGVNTVSKNLLICDRQKLISPHGFYLGVSGSGKSMGMKNTITQVALNTDDDIIIIDAEREYGELTKALGGEVVVISPGSDHRIDPMEMSETYGVGENPIAMKSELITTILEQQMGPGMLHAGHKSIIDRCTSAIFRPYLADRKNVPSPVLTDWRNEVLKQTDPEARDLALASEILTEGSLNIFSRHSNVDLRNRIITFDLYEMGESLRSSSHVVTLEVTTNRVAENRRKGKFTWVFIDEVYLYFKYKYSAEILYRSWKRYRKYGATMTAATQNVEECLRSETARLMFANSEFLLLFNQAATDRQELAKLLHISDTQMNYITNSQPGCGLLRMGSSLVPFSNQIPRDSILYKLMNTTPGNK